MYDLMEAFKAQVKYCATDEELKDIRIWYSMHIVLFIILWEKMN